MCVEVNISRNALRHVTEVGYIYVRIVALRYVIQGGQNPRSLPGTAGGPGQQVRLWSRRSIREGMVF